MGIGVGIVLGAMGVGFGGHVIYSITSTTRSNSFLRAFAFTHRYVCPHQLSPDSRCMEPKLESLELRLGSHCPANSIAIELRVIYKKYSLELSKYHLSNAVLIMASAGDRI